MRKTALFLCATIVFAGGNVCQAETPQEKLEPNINSKFESCKPPGHTASSIRNKDFNDYYKFWSRVAVALAKDNKIEESQELLLSTINQLRDRLKTGKNPKRATLLFGNVDTPDEAIGCLFDAARHIFDIMPKKIQDALDALEETAARKKGTFLESLSWARVNEEETVTSKVQEILDKVGKEIPPHHVAFFFDLKTLEQGSDGRSPHSTTELLLSLNEKKIPWFVVTRNEDSVTSTKFRTDVITAWTHAVLATLGLFVRKAMDSSTYKKETVEIAETEASPLKDSDYIDNLFDSLTRKISKQVHPPLLCEDNENILSPAVCGMNIPEIFNTDLTLGRNIFLLSKKSSQHKGDSLTYVLSHTQGIKHIVYVDSDAREIQDMKKFAEERALNKNIEDINLRLIWYPKTQREQEPEMRGVKKINDYPPQPATTHNQGDL